jgi:O-antigen ligase
VEGIGFSFSDDRRSSRWICTRVVNDRQILGHSPTLYNKRTIVEPKDPMIGSMDGESLLARPRDFAVSGVQAHCRRAAFYFAWASAVSILVSIAVSQILLGLGVAALLVSGEKLRFPPVRLPLVLFFAVTILALLASGAPVHGLPQLRKFYVFLILFLLFHTFRTTRQIRSLVLGWTAVGSISALVGLFQLGRLWLRADPAQVKDYGYFLYNRPTGFSSHWMTFGGEEMIVLLAILSLLCFSTQNRGKLFGLVCAPALFLVLVLSLTRSVFLVGFPVGAMYLLWHWKRRLLLIAPPLAILVLLLSPLEISQRAVSVLAPHQGMDSNSQRLIDFRTGLAMIATHPWLGLGPEQIAGQFLQYVPRDIPRPLPFGWYGHLHNVYLQFAAERGVPGMLVMMWFIGQALRDGVRARRRSSADAAFVFHASTAVILAVLAEGCFEYNLGDSEVLTMFLTMVGCTYVAAAERSTPSMSPASFTAVLRNAGNNANSTVNNELIRAKV